MGYQKWGREVVNLDRNQPFIITILLIYLKGEQYPNRLQMTLSNIHLEDIDATLAQMEQSFQISIQGTENNPIETFGDLTDHVLMQLPQDVFSDCTSQQAFYKLRDAFSIVNPAQDDIQPATKLETLLPRKNRRKVVQLLGDMLGVQLNILQPPFLVWLGSLLFFFFSVGMLFFDGILGLSLISVSIFAFHVGNKLGKELKFDTVGELALYMTRFHYLKSRRYPDQINPEEVKQILVDWFHEEYGVEHQHFTPEARFS